MLIPVGSRCPLVASEQIQTAHHESVFHTWSAFPHFNDFNYKAQLLLTLPRNKCLVGLRSRYDPDYLYFTTLSLCCTPLLSPLFLLFPLPFPLSTFVLASSRIAHIINSQERYHYQLLDHSKLVHRMSILKGTTTIVIVIVHSISNAAYLSISNI